MTEQMTIKAMAEKTEDSYSFNAYGQSGWNGAIRVLRARGMNDLEVEAFLRSKHTRWAGDSDCTRRYGAFNGKTVEEYLAKTTVSQADLDDLVAGTF